MPTSRPSLTYDVFVAPEKLAKAPPPRVADPPAWDPTTSTLIFGARGAVLVDALMTVREATALADWIDLHDRRLTTIYITHGHGDHYSGLSVVLDRFPDARAVATAGTVEQMRNGSATAHPYRAWFPGQIADTIPLAEPLDAGHFELEGLPLEVIETGHTDTVDSTSLYVPDLSLGRHRRRRLQPLPHVCGRDDPRRPGRMDRRPRQAGRAPPSCCRHRP